MHADSWAIKAKQLGLRSRAVFKLEEILQKTKVFIGEVRLPIGESYKESVLKHLGV